MTNPTRRKCSKRDVHNAPKQSLTCRSQPYPTLFISRPFFLASGPSPSGRASSALPIFGQRLSRPGNTCLPYLHQTASSNLPRSQTPSFAPLLFPFLSATFSPFSLLYYLDDCSFPPRQWEYTFPRRPSNLRPDLLQSIQLRMLVSHLSQQRTHNFLRARTISGMRKRRKLTR